MTFKYDGELYSLPRDIGLFEGLNWFKETADSVAGDGGEYFIVDSPTFRFYFNALKPGLRFENPTLKSIGLNTLKCRTVFVVEDFLDQLH